MATSHLKELVYFALKLGELVGKLADGFHLPDLLKVLEVVRAAPAAISGAAAALAEYRGMTDAEASDLETFIAASFDLDNDTIEKVIEDALDVIIKLHGFARFAKKPV